MLKAKNLSGKRFTRLLVISRNYDAKYQTWSCVCDCGNTLMVQSSNLKSGHVKSCGCYNNEMRTKTHKKHGLSLTTEYVIWRNMISRCNDTINPNYKDYGERGISVCDEWVNSLDCFIKDMGKRPSKELTLDRRDNDGNYEPSNCRWADVETQANNRRNTRRFNYKNKILTIAEILNETGFDKSLLISRIDRGWGIEDILSVPKYMKRSEWMNK